MRIQNGNFQALQVNACKEKKELKNSSEIDPRGRHGRAAPSMGGRERF